MRNVCVAIPFVRVNADQNPNMKVKAGQDPADAYLRSMVVAFASVRRFNPLVELQLITNQEPPEPYKTQLLDLGVNVALKSFDHRPPAGFSPRFNASLYLIDSLESLKHHTTILIDPDVLCVRPLDTLLAATKNSVGVLPINYDANHNVNGISRLEAGKLHALLGEPTEVPAHYGGEVYILPHEHVETLRRRCDLAWEFSLTRDRLGLSKFFTEEHILSFALRATPTTAITPHVRRIWTAHRLRQVTGLENELSLWHLPAEKDRGFAQLYPRAIESYSWFWTSNHAEFVEAAGRAMGFHHRSLKRFLADVAGQAIHSFRPS